MVGINSSPSFYNKINTELQIGKSSLEISIPSTTAFNILGTINDMQTRYSANWDSSLQTLNEFTSSLNSMIRRTLDEIPEPDIKSKYFIKHISPLDDRYINTKIMQRT